MHDCAMIDLGSMQWMTMQCDSQLDWICKMPKGMASQPPVSIMGITQIQIGTRGQEHLPMGALPITRAARIPV